MKISAVYKITNTVTGDFYIGSSKDVKKRWKEHKCPSSLKRFPNNQLYQDMQKYGVDKFDFQILEVVEEGSLKVAEQQFIETLKPTYNSNRANGWDIERRKKYKKEYNKSDKVKEYQKEYQKSDKGKEAQKKYQKSDKGKEAQKKYQKSDKGKEAQKKYNKSDKGKETQKKYQKSDKGKESQKKAVNKYNNQLCCYNGETLTLQALRMRFKRKGIINPTQEAKKYLLEQSI